MNSAIKQLFKQKLILYELMGPLKVYHLLLKIRFPKEKTNGVSVPKHQYLKDFLLFYHFNNYKKRCMNYSILILQKVIIKHI